MLVLPFQRSAVPPFQAFQRSEPGGWNAERPQQVAAAAAFRVPNPKGWNVERPQIPRLWRFSSASPATAVDQPMALATVSMIPMNSVPTHEKRSSSARTVFIVTSPDRAPQPAIALSRANRGRKVTING